MLSGSIVVFVTVVSLVSLTPSDRINPYFACTTNSYNVLPNESDEIMLNNCSASVLDEIIGLLRQSELRERPLRVSTSTTTVNHTSLELAATTVDFDFSDFGLSKIDLGSAERLKRLNLTSNKFHSLTSIRLHENVILNSLDMSYNRLSVLRSNAIPSTVRLFLRSNTIQELDTNFTLPDVLLELDLTRNEIENVSLVTFSSPRLTVLNLSINLINAISRTTFGRLPAMRILSLECNKIVDIEPNTFDRNVNLIELNLRDNNLFTLRNGVFDNLLNLRALDVSKNRLLRLTPENVRELNNLVHFSLSENSRLCQNHCKRDLQFLLMLGGRLRVLKMSRLGLQTFPVMLTTSIRTLDLSANKLASVQTGDLENFPFLEVLDLSGNLVVTSERDIFSRMEYLRELYLQDNRLTRVPSLLPPSMRVLRLDGNRIRAVSSHDFRNLHKLATLRLDSNSIYSIESAAFTGLSNLIFLDISRNPIQQLRMDTFEGANTLNTLFASDLVTVGINATDPRYFPISELPNLRYLNLSRSAELARCFLRDYPLLATVKQLEQLDLDNTNLTRAPSHLRNFLPRLKLLSLRGNPINCDDEDDDSFGEWKEAYRLERPAAAAAHHLTHKSDTKDLTMTVRVTRRTTQPVCDRVIIRSGCESASASNTNCPIMIKDDFWSNFARPGPSNFRRRKLSLRSLTEKTVVDRAIIWDSATTILLPTTASATQQTIRKTTTTAAAVSAKLPIEDSSTMSFLIRSTNISSKSDGRTSFVDLFPSLNDSTADRAQTVDRKGGNHYSRLENTHPGLFIFLFMSVLVLMAFGSVIAPLWVQTRVMNTVWRRRQHQTSHSGHRNQPYIQISNISTFVDSEIHEYLD